MVYISGISSIGGNRIRRNGSLLPVPEATGTSDFATQVYEWLKPEYPKFYKMDLPSQLAFLAAEILLQELPLSHYDPTTMALTLTSASGSLDTDLRYAASARTLASPALFVYTLPNIAGGELCIRHKLKGENTFFITPAFDAPLLAGHVEQTLRIPGMEACIGGWIEAVNGHHDVFLYLAEKTKRGMEINHTANEIEKLYQSHYGTVDGGSEKTDHRGA
jgi:hypothetical protein